MRRKHIALLFGYSGIGFLYFRRWEDTFQSQRAKQTALEITKEDTKTAQYEVTNYHIVLLPVLSFDRTRRGC